MAHHLLAARYDQASAVMPRTIAEIVSGDHPPVSLLVRAGVPMSKISAQLEFELVKILPLVSVGGSLNSTQVEFVAGALLEAFPNETLADFKIAFQRGCIGQYGDIFRLDGIVIRGWVTKYLEEKYEEVEKQARKLKDAEKQKADEKYLSPVALESLDKMRASLGDNTKRSVGMTDAEIRKNGQQNPPVRPTLTTGEKTFYILGMGQNASTLKEAKVRIRKLIKAGYLDFGMSRGNAKSRRK